MDPSVHGTAIVEEGAQVGEGTRVWHHAHVRSGAHVGADCVLGKNVYVDSGVTVGDGCHIQNNVSLYSGVTLGGRVFVGPHVVFTNDLSPRAGNNEWQIIPTRVEEGASIGANATIVCGIVIGRCAMVGAGAVVTQDVEANGLVLGVPARLSGWVCRNGHTVSHSGDPLPSPTRCERCGSMVPERIGSRS